MVEVGVSKRINSKKLNALFNFLFSISDHSVFKLSIFIKAIIFQCIDFFKTVCYIFNRNKI